MAIIFSIAGVTALYLISILSNPPLIDLDEISEEIPTFISIQEGK